MAQLPNDRRMKAYGVHPTFDLLAHRNEARTDACIELVAKIVCDRLRQGGDSFHVTVDWRDPGAEPWSVCTEGLAKANVIALADPDYLQEVVRFSVDPFSEKSAAVIRSTATCRAATFGYDGQAFICLRHEDEPPASPDPALVVVEERPDLLTETDYFDGVIVSS